MKASEIWKQLKPYPQILSGMKSQEKRQLYLAMVRSQWLSAWYQVSRVHLSTWWNRAQTFKPCLTICKRDTIQREQFCRSIKLEWRSFSRTRGTLTLTHICQDTRRGSILPRILDSDFGVLFRSMICLRLESTSLRTFDHRVLSLTKTFYCTWALGRANERCLARKSSDVPP